MPQQNEFIVLGDAALWRPTGGTAGEEPGWNPRPRRRGPMCPDGERAAARRSLRVRLHPLAEATGIASWADG